MPDLSSIGETIANAQQQVARARSLVADGDAAVTAQASLQSYQLAANAAEQAAMLSQSVTAVLQTEVPSAVGLDAAVGSLVQSASASDGEAGLATTPAAARVAALAGVQSAESAIPLAQQAASMFNPPPRVTVGVVGALAIAGVVTTVAWFTVRHFAGHGAAHANPMMLRDRATLEDAKATLWEPLADWVQRPSAGKERLFAAYDGLSERQKTLLDEDVARVFQREYGSDAVTVYRYRDRGDMAGKSVSTVEPRYLGAGNYATFRIHASDVLAHYGQEGLPLGGKQFGHEREIILKPGARTERVQENPMERLTAATILAAADAQMGRRDRRAYYDRRRKKWIVELLDSDPTLYYAVGQDGDGIYFNGIDD